MNVKAQDIFNFTKMATYNVLVEAQYWVNNL